MVNANKKEKEFFLVHNEDTGKNTLFHHWVSVINSITNVIMQNGYCIIHDPEDNNIAWFSHWRPPKDREECFNLLFNVKDIGELNELLVELYYIELIEFSD